MDENVGVIDFLRTVEELADFPLDDLKSHQFACSVHLYRSGSVIVSNSKESEWIYVVKLGSCQVYKAIKSKPKDRRRKYNKNQPADVSADTVSGDTGTTFMLPPIRIGKASGAKTTVSLLTKEARQPPGLALRSSILQLPKISFGEGNRLVSRTSSTSDSGYGSTHSDDEVQLARKKQKPSKYTKDSDKLPSSPATFARLDVLKERGIFGLQSLLYEESPVLSLVSRDAECVLISKQFLLDRLDSGAIARLRRKVPPYPSVLNVTSTTEENAHRKLFI